MDPGIRRIGFILFEGADLLDAVGPAGAFACAARQFARTGAPCDYPIDYFSPDGGAVSTLEALAVETLKLRDLEADEYDTIIVVGGDFRWSDIDDRVVAWLRRNHGRMRRLGSVCAGAAFLARAGLLDGRAATTHWNECDTLEAEFPAVQVQRDSIFVADSGVWTSAGITAGVDMALAMIEEDHGHPMAMYVARTLVVFLKRPGGQAQFSTELQCQAVEGPLAPLLKWIAENPAADLRAETLADRAHMSLRNFYRAFEEATGTSPADWVERVRLEIARRLLEQTGQNVDQVARVAGFTSSEQMRRAFARRFGVSPTEYRARFSRRDPSADVDLDLLTDAWPGAEAPLPLH
ncbi:MAG TPA: helix-turn-helix domain-containing protein [Allosphingosinicella sp.]